MALPFRRLAGLREKADRLQTANATALSEGNDGLVVEAYAAQLAVADRYLAQQRLAEASAWFGRATTLAFDRTLHFDRTTSPLVAHARRYVQPLSESATAKTLRAAPEAATERSDAQLPRRFPTRCTPRPGKQAAVRVLVVTRRNGSFLAELLGHLSHHPDFEHRFVRLVDRADPVRGVGNPAKMAMHLLEADGTPRAVRRAERVLGSNLEWADVIFVEWCTAAAVLLSRADLRGARLIIRLHSYEAFTAWPHLVDFTGVDDLLFVSEHIKELAVAAIPALTEPEAPDLHVLPLGLRLDRFVRPKSEEARFTLGLIGWGSAAKDPLWAFEVLRRLRRHDSRYGLKLIGADFDDTASAAAREYGDRLWPELTELEEAGAVRRTGQTADVPAALSDVGVILSSSVRESFHAALVEGAASGAVPVVRDWPFFRNLASGPRDLFPEDWVVDDEDEAVERILRMAADDEAWRSAGQSATDTALERWDWSVTQRGYERLLSRGR